MLVSVKWIEWAHGPAAQSGNELSGQLCDIASEANNAGNKSAVITDPALIREVKDVAELYHPIRGTCLEEVDYSIWWKGQPKKIIDACKEALR